MYMKIKNFVKWGYFAKESGQTWQSYSAHDFAEVNIILYYSSNFDVDLVKVVPC